MAEIALIAAAAWVAIVLIVLAICRAANREDKSANADRDEQRAKGGAVSRSVNADRTVDRPSKQE